MNRIPTRRYGAALVLSFATLVASFVHAGAADAPDARPADAGAAKAADAAPTAELRHGSRSKAADGTLVVYDKVTGVYRVPGRDDTYWIDGRYFEYSNGLWLAAPVAAGPWNLVPEHVVPEAARGRHLPPKTSVVAKLPSGRDAVYEPSLKAYKVAGRKGVFLFDAGYYRYDHGVWLESKTDEGPWTPTSPKPLPQVLRRALPLPEEGRKVVLPSGETLVFEANTNLFTVEGRPDTVYFEGVFYERREDKWFRSTKGTTAFEAMSPTEVPGPVRSKYHKGGKTKDAGKNAKKGGSQKAAGGAKKAADE